MATFADPALIAVAATSAGVAGVCLGVSWAARRRAAERRRALRHTVSAHENRAAGGEGLDEHLIRFAVDTSRRVALGVSGLSFLRERRFDRVELWLDTHAKKAGLTDEVSPAGFVEAAVRLALGCAAAGALVGAVISNELGLIGGLLGGVWGATALPRTAKRLMRVRAVGLERDLSEMLEVVALGLRSGLSFDRSFGLYADHFDTRFAGECAQAVRVWSSGLATREEALRSLAASYDSPLLARVVESVVRSLRFGASLAEGLELSAAEARAIHRAHVEERVAKAPVKMMVPTGTLILPAMLLLVLGPVLLELMEGF